MKRIKHIGTLLIILCMTVMMCGTAAWAAPTISTKKATIEVGSTLTLTVNGAGTSKITWKTSKKSVATVTAKGVVTGKKAGSAKITAKVGKKKLTCTVKVTAKPLKINSSSVTMTAGSTYRLSVAGLGKSDKVTWKTSNKAVATVSASGEVKGLKAGSAKITAKVGKKSLTSTVTVKAVTAKLNVNSVTLQTGGKYTLSLLGTKAKVAWSTSNKSVATVTAGGVVAGVKAGSARITGQADGKSYVCTVTVKAPATTTKTTTKKTTTTTAKPVTGQASTAKTTATTAASAAVVKITDGSVPISLRPSASNKNYSSDWARELTILNRMLKAYNTVYKYHDGLTYTNAHFYEWYGGIYAGGYGCAGFCFELSDAAFIQTSAGKNVSPMAKMMMIDNMSISQIKSTLRVGDILRVEYNTHSVIVIAKEEDGVVVAESNYNKAVKWGRRITYADIKKTGSNIMTRYDSTPLPLSTVAKLAEGLPLLDGTALK